MEGGSHDKFVVHFHVYPYLIRYSENPNEGMGIGRIVHDQSLLHFVGEKRLSGLVK